MQKNQCASFLYEIAQHIKHQSILNNHQIMSSGIFGNKTHKEQDQDIFADPVVTEKSVFFTIFNDASSSEQEKPRSQCMNERDQNQIQSKKKISKIDKVKIRTNRNSHKFYHNILKHWLSEKGCKSMILKYSFYFNQRVYFILVLNQIQKHMDGRQFAQQYKRKAQQVISRKRQQMEHVYNLKPGCEQGHHLQRAIDEIIYSIKACQAFMDGNIYKSLEIVYKRNQSNITIMTKFNEALKIFYHVTGYQPENIQSDDQL